MSKQQAVKLVLENINMLDEAYAFIEEELEPTIFGVIDEVVKNFVEQELDSTKGVFNFHENEINFTIPLWETEKNEQSPSWKNSLARYILISEKVLKENEENQFWLTTLFSNQKDRMAFVFYPCWGNEKIKQTKNKWKTFLKNQNEAFPQLQALGFKFYPDDLCWYLPIKPLDVQQVIACYEEDNLEDAMGPIQDALNTLLEGHQYFLKIIENAKHKENF
ncbi:hypothetical protein [Pasteurella multocida]|uniref:hypothetical protein n=1 Tax=Pasteurella multocida TaxID=747 RepID=UPI000E01DE45|nr:hypothetical protein [Pasteurella multocida]MCL7818404.1 hypothetical protein [Pasteurella multocida]MDY0578882.1 hypothetical protein [Pasteurella multocida]MEB3458415.1 hypothetical protein [Pasteurella multocida]MEB3472557.1 hypothetical protein [Pasteurella multocida]MEB3487986.1 hypothetical protein [Pasteurella multocida]